MFFFSNVLPGLSIHPPPPPLPRPRPPVLQLVWYDCHGEPAATSYTHLWVFDTGIGPGKLTLRKISRITRYRDSGAGQDRNSVLCQRSATKKHVVVFETHAHTHSSSTFFSSRHTRTHARARTHKHRHPQTLAATNTHRFFRSCPRWSHPSLVQLSTQFWGHQFCVLHGRSRLISLPAQHQHTTKTNLDSQASFAFFIDLPAGGAWRCTKRESDRCVGSRVHELPVFVPRRTLRKYKALWGKPRNFAAF